MLSEVPPLPCDGLVIINDSTLELPRKLKHAVVPDIDHDSLFECPDVVLSEDDASSASASSSGKGSVQSLKRVSFSTVEVREYSLTVGDHPFCRDGLPITLDWEFNEKCTVIPVPRESRKRNKDGFPRRLDYQERLLRLQCVTGIVEKHMLLIQNHRVWSRKDKSL
jgi:hypothetical protein